MPDTSKFVREAAAAIGLKLSEERLPAIAAAVDAARKQVDVMLIQPTPTPVPTAFDASWSAKN